MIKSQKSPKQKSLKSPRPRNFRAALLVSLLAIAAAVPSSSAPDHPQPLTGTLATPITDSILDNASFADWVNGAEHPLANPVALRQVVWTQTTEPPTDRFVQFGVSSQPGIRYLRLGFTRAIPVGSVLVRGGGSLSVLRANAPYPGNLADDSQWIPAQRIVNHQLVATEVDQSSFGLWVLPPGTTTRSIRFTHTAAVTDASFNGVLCGIYVFANRFANLAPQAVVTPSANTRAAPLLVDEKLNDWRGWDNGPDFPHAVTASTPEWITLTWPRTVALRGLAALWAGFNAADAQAFSGPDSANPQSAPDADWHSIGQPIQTHSQYPRALGIDWLDFGKTVQTRAVRLRITQVTDETHHPHLLGKTHNGNRVWLGEVMALTPLESTDLHSALLALPTAAASPTPPIPVPFTLGAPGYVTLVIDDAQGNRVRNLIADTWFEAGPNTVWWDGADDLRRNDDAATHGVYLIPTHFVAPGRYTVRGLYHKAIDLHYEFTVYSAGDPPWETANGKGGWLTNHTSASGAVFVPGDKAPGGKPLVYLGSYVSEGGAGFAWVDLDGHKLGGERWVAGGWTGAPYLASDAGPHADPANYVYSAAVWGANSNDPKTSMHVTLRIAALTDRGDKSVLVYPFDTGGTPLSGETVRQGWIAQIGGLAVRNSLAVVSLSRRNELLFSDVHTAKPVGIAAVRDPRGVAFDNEGNLLVLSGNRLLSYVLPTGLTQIHPQELPAPRPLIESGLEDPVGIALDDRGNLYISDRGSANQVKVYNSAGKALRDIGHSGPSKAGPYDPLHMNNPRGLTIDGNNHLWVAEEDFQPKRVSLWTLDGKLLKAFYGPPEYGGGGALDYRDKTKFYYHGMEFKLDWTNGASQLNSILYRPGNNDLQPPIQGSPANVLYSNGHRYFTNSYLVNETSGVTVGALYLDQGGVIKLVAALGKANDWPIFQQDVFKSHLPPNTDLTSRAGEKSVLFTWSDANDNGKVDIDEVTFLKANTGSVTITSDPSSAGPVMLASFVDGKAMRYEPVRVTPAGIPIYNLSHGQVLVDGAQKQASDGGGQMLTSPVATVLTTAPLPFAPEGVGGVDKQGHRWSYPSLWPGLHPSHSAPVPDRPGELAGATRLLGDFIYPNRPDVGPLWAINGNYGDLYLFTADGLFVTQLFQDIRVGKPWNMPVAIRNMPVNDISLHDEDFFPTLTQTSDRKVYVNDGNDTNLVRVDGFDSLERLPSSTLELTKSDIDRAQKFLELREAARQSATGIKTLTVTVRQGPAPALEDLAGSLNSADWATIDSRIAKVGWGDKPDVAEAAITIAAGRLYAAFRTNDPNLLRNSGAVPNAPFKSGGALDLMIGSDPQANPNRRQPAVGDERLLVYRVNNRAKALLYRAVVLGTGNPVVFTAPDRSISFDRVIDVSSQVQLDCKDGNYAISIPLDTLGLKPIAGQAIKADIGILRGNGTQTVQRVYWSDKATGITSDVPSEAELSPNLWGQWVFKSMP